jgi:hypothetical protein
MEVKADAKDTSGGRVRWPAGLARPSGGGRPKHRGSGQHTMNTKYYNFGLIFDTREFYSGKYT